MHHSVPTLSLPATEFLCSALAILMRIAAVRVQHKMAKTKVTMTLICICNKWTAGPQSGDHKTFLRDGKQEEAYSV
jgi:hypothetical protein